MAQDQMYPFIEAIKKALFQAENRRLVAGIDRLVEQDAEMNPGRHEMGFLYSGEIYRHSRSSTIYRSWPLLSWPLNVEMEAWLKDKKILALDRDQIGQILFKLMYQANDLQEMRDTLPECLVSLVPDFQKMPRMHNQEFLIRHNERDLRQFRKLLPKIELYAMSKLIY